MNKNKSFISILILSFLIFLGIMISFNNYYISFGLKESGNINEAKKRLGKLKKAAKGINYPKETRLIKYFLLKEKAANNFILGNSQLEFLGRHSPETINLTLSGKTYNELVFFLNNINHPNNTVLLGIPFYFYSSTHFGNWPQDIQALISRQKDFMVSGKSRLTLLEKIQNYYLNPKVFFDGLIFYLKLLTQSNSESLLDSGNLMLKNGARLFTFERVTRNEIEKQVEADLKRMDLFISRYGLKNELKTYQKRLKQYLKEKNEIDIVLMVPPHNIELLESKERRDLIEYLKKYQDEVIHLGRELGLKVIGGISVCPQKDFIDLYHGNLNCLKRAQENILVQERLP